MFLTMCIAGAVIALVLYVFLREGRRAQDGSQTQLLMAKEVRRHPRVALAVPVEVHTAERRLHATSQNISPGGMRLRVEAPLSIAQPIELRFTLPDAPAIRIPAVVSRKHGDMIGVRFDPTHHERFRIESWVEASARRQAAKGTGV